MFQPKRIFLYCLYILLSVNILFARNTISSQSENIFATHISQFLDGKYELSPKKILVFSSSRSEKTDAVNLLFQEIEKTSNGAFKFTFTESLSQFDHKNLEKFDCVVLNGSNKNLFIESTILNKHLPPALLEVEKERNQIYINSLKEYINSSVGFIVIGEGIPAELNIEQSSEAYSNIPIILKSANLFSATGGRSNFLINEKLNVLKTSSKISAKNYHVLVSTDSEFFRGGEIPLAWIEEFDSNRAFYTSLLGDVEFFKKYPELISLYVYGLNYVVKNKSNINRSRSINELPKTDKIKSISYLREIENPDSEIWKYVLKNVQSAIWESPENGIAAEKICLEDITKDIGTRQYKIFLSNILLENPLSDNSFKLVDVIRRECKNNENKQFVENLIKVIAKSKDKSATKNLEELLTSDVEYVRIVALKSISEIGNKNSDLVAEKYARDILKDKSASKSLKIQAVNSLLKIGAEVDVNLVTEESINFLGDNKDIKIPHNINFNTVIYVLHTALINALAKRQEAYDEIIKIEPENSFKASIITRAIVKFSNEDGIRKMFDYANLYSDTEMNAVASVFASAKIENKFKYFWDLQNRFTGKSKDLAQRVLFKIKSSQDIDFLFDKILNDKNGKLLASSLLKEIKTSQSYISGKSIKFFKSAKTLEDKVIFLQLLSLNQTKETSDICISAYNEGLKSEVIQELSKWQNASILKELYLLYKIQNSKDKKDLERLMLNIMKNSKVVDKYTCDFLLNNALDQSLKEKVLMLQRGDLKSAKMQSTTTYLKAFSSVNQEHLKNAFDGDEKTSYDVNGNFEIFLELSKINKLKALEFKIDFLPDFKLYGGISIFEMKEIKYTTHELSSGVYRLIFDSPLELKFIKIEQLNENKLSYKFFDISFINDSSVYIQGLDRVGRFITSASENPQWSKLVFDDNKETCWKTNSNKESRQWFFIGLDKVRKMSSIEVFFGKDKSNRILSPKIYIGKNVEELYECEIECLLRFNSDLIKFKVPAEARFIVIENGKADNSAWKISEIRVR